jgi:hypothetical protein
MLSLADRPAVGAVPLGVVPFVVADGIVKIARMDEAGTPNNVRYCNGSGVGPVQLGGGGKDFVCELARKKVAYHERGSQEQKPSRGMFEEWMSSENRGNTIASEEARRGGRGNRRQCGRVFDGVRASQANSLELRC